MIILGAWIGCQVTLSYIKPEIIEVPVVETVEIPVVTERLVIEYVDRIVERKVLSDYRLFHDLNEFLAWSDGKICRLLWQDDDCDDYAEALQMLAYHDGYLLSCHLVQNGKVLDVYVSPTMGNHMGILLMTEKEIYYVEPQPDAFSIVKICNRD
jgi:hypothetical protein